MNSAVEEKKIIVEHRTQKSERRGSDEDMKGHPEAGIHKTANKAYISSLHTQPKAPKTPTEESTFHNKLKSQTIC